MLMVSSSVTLRRPEPKDAAQLFIYRNDWEVTQFLGGFSMGYAPEDLKEWVERHRKLTNEVIWIIAEKSTDLCLGHVGLYNIDHRVRKAEFAILIGDKTQWGKGLGTQVSKSVINYGFEQLNLHRIELDVVSNNPRAVQLYEKLGFRHEGIRRDAQFRDGLYVDVINMGLLEHERNWG